MLADWTSRAARGEDRSRADEVARRRLHQLLDMPGVADLLGAADGDARALAEGAEISITSTHLVRVR